VSIILPNGSEASFLTSYMAVAAIGGGHRYRLYTNDVTGGLTPDQVEALTAGAFTEATFTGYSSVVRSGGWTVTPGNPTKATNTAVTFTRSSTGATQTIRGYYVTAVADGALSWFEPFRAPVNITSASDAITVTPTLALEDSGGNMVPVGLISPYGATTPPGGWLACDGAAVSRTTYASLYAVLGNSYGAGDGATTFNVPDLRQRFPLGKAASGTGATIGGTGGAIDHEHGLRNPNSGAAMSWTASPSPLKMHRRSGGPISFDANVVTTTNAQALGGSTDTGVNGGIALTGDTEDANPPYQVVAYIIRAG